MAVTAHWIGRDEVNGTTALNLKAALIAFYYLPSRHSGAEIAKSLLILIDRDEIPVSKVRTVCIECVSFTVIYPWIILLDRPLHP
jgi:hypothetical protein